MFSDDVTVYRRHSDCSQRKLFDLLRRSILRRLLLALLATFGIGASFLCAVYLANGARPDDPQNTRIVAGRIEGQEYFVPKDYFFLEGGSFENRNIYVMAMYPSFAPGLESHQRIWERGEWWKHVSILAQYYDAPATAEKQAMMMIALRKATELVGEEYGLTHQTQSKSGVQDHEDIWLERDASGTITSYVMCGDKLSQISVPQCKMTFYWENNFNVKASFNKRLLPYWKEIKLGIIELLDSFKSEDSSVNFRTRSIQNFNSNLGDMK